MKYPFLTAAILLAVLMIFGCSSDDDPVTPVTQDVNAYLAALPSWEEFSPKMQSTDGALGYPVGEVHWEEGQLYVCSMTSCSITETPEAIATFDPSTEILWLGSLIQGKTYLGGLAAMEELPIRQRSPLTITIQLINNENVHRTVDNPTMATVNQAISELAIGAESSPYKPSSTMSFEKKDCYSLEQGMLKMGMSVSYMGTSVSGQLEMNQTYEEHSVVAYFRQRMFTVSLVLPQTPGEFFASDFTVSDMKAQEDLGRIGPDNLPAFVSSITYGRILVMTMTSTYSETEMKAALQASYDGIVDVSGEVSTEQKEILQNSTINIVAVGGEEGNARDLIRTGDLGAYFMNDVDLTSALPISYTIRNLANNSLAQVSETTDYEILECSTDAVAYFGDYDLWHNAVLQLPNGEDLVQGLGADEITDASQIATTPAGNDPLGWKLTFPGIATGLPLDFDFNSPNAEMVYNDNEFSGSFYPCLSIGDVDNWDNDDFELKVTATNPGYTVMALGIFVMDNERESGETLRVYGENDLLLQEFTSGVLPHYGSGFMGVISAVPLTRFYFNEHSGGDDICTKDFHFGVASQ